MYYLFLDGSEEYQVHNSIQVYQHFFAAISLWKGTKNAAVLLFAEIGLR